MGHDSAPRGHQDERHHQEQAIARLRKDLNRLEDRLEAMYIDKLGGQINPDSYERKTAEWREEQDRLRRTIAGHEAADLTYIEEGIRLLDVVRHAHALFAQQEPREKRLLLNSCGLELHMEGRDPAPELPATLRSTCGFYAGVGREPNSSHGRSRAI